MFGGALTAALTLLASESRALTLENLQGMVINASAVYDTVTRRNGREVNAQTTWTMHMSIGSGGAYQSAFSRVVTFQGRNVGSINRSSSGTIGVPHATSSGHAVWLLSGSKLIALRTFEVGGIKAEITLGAGTCSLRAPLAREVGTANIRMPSAVRPGTQAEILSARQISASCSVSR